MARKARPAPALEGGDTPLAALPGVGPRTAEKLAARGLTRLADLWLWLPRDYQDRTRVTAIAELQAGMPAQVEGRILASASGFRFRPTLKVAIADASRATLILRFFHFRGAQADAFRQGARIRAYGTPRAGASGLEMVHPSYRMLGEDDAGLGEALTPVYPALEGIGPQALARLIERALGALPDDETLELLPPNWLRALGLPRLREAVQTLHQPPADIDITLLQSGRHPAQRRLALEELLAHHLSLRRQRIALQRHRAHPLSRRGKGVARLLAALPFPLTAAQARVFDEIQRDLAGDTPMLRLLQGDVALGVLACRSVHSKGRRWRGRRNCCPRGQTRSRPSPLTLKVALPRPTIRSSSSWPLHS